MKREPIRRYGKPASAVGWRQRIHLLTALWVTALMVSTGQAQQLAQQFTTSANYVPLSWYSSSAADDPYSQRLYLELESVSYDEALQRIMEESTLRFSYDRESLPAGSLTYSAEGQTLLEAIAEIFSSTDLEILASPGGQIVLKPRLEATWEDAFQETISGRVTDAVTGEGLPGVNILVEGTEVGTATDAEGTFELNVQDLEATLIVSYIGYETQQVPLDGQTTLDIELEMGVLAQDEIVVVGYGTQARETLSGSVSSIGGERLESVPVTNMANSLAGQMPGIITINQSGEPGADGSTLRIRGDHTLNNNSPLIVIDGVPDRAGGLERLNPRDIENVTILKDASAAIYGSRAANGVILITTKRGVAGDPVFSVDFNQGFNQPTRIPDMANAPTYMTMLNEIDLYANNAPRYTQEQIECHARGEDPWLCPDTDWFRESLKPLSLQSRGDVSVSGGSETFRYRISGSGLTEDGYYRNSATRYNEYGFRTNLDGQLSDNLSLSLDLHGRYEDRNYPTVSASEIFRMLTRGKPNEPGFWPNGLPAPDIENGVNPVVTGTDATGFDRDERYLFNSRVGVNFEVPGVQGLELQANVTYDKDFRQRKLWEVPWELYDFQGFDEAGEPQFATSLVPNPDPRLQQWAEDGGTTMLNFLGNYSLDLESHSFNFLLGTERQRISNSGFWAFRRHFPTTEINELFVGSQVEQNLGGGGRSAPFNSAIDYPTEASRLNFFSRINYNYQSKYMLELIGRYDGSYIFPEGSRFGFFPSVSAAWRLTQEEWFSSALPLFDELKLRASFGQTGNDRINPYQFLRTYQFGEPYIFNHRQFSTIYVARTPNPNVTWEVANQFDVGIEAAVLGNRLYLELDYFQNRRDDILHYRNASVPQTAGVSLPQENIGQVKSYGFDGSVSWRDQLSSDFMLDITFNVGYAENEIQFWDEPPGAPEWQRSTGYRMGTGLYYRAIGVFQDEEHVASYPSWSDARPGDIIFEDVDGNGRIDADDRVRINKNHLPKWTGGLNFRGSYRAFDFTVFFQGAAGHVQYVLTQSGDFGNYFNQFAQERWRPDPADPTAMTPHPDFGVFEGPRSFQREDEYWIANSNTYFLYDADYIRLKNLEIGYTLPASVGEALGLNRLRVYANGFNLFTIDKFGLMDPEDIDPAGMRYIQKRVINMGVSLSF